MSMPTSLATAKRACSCGAMEHTSRLVAFTGGPGAGKTAVLEVLRAELCEHVAILPEAAGILFIGGFPRSESVCGRRAAQRAIAFTQREIERWALAERRFGAVLCDRGTIDGLAYWPDAEAAFFEALGRSREDELSRYAAVIHLRTPDDAFGYNLRNPARIETAARAREIDEAIANAWRGHPNRHFIDAQASFLEKTRRAVELTKGFVPECCASQKSRSAT